MAEMKDQNPFVHRFPLTLTLSLGEREQQATLAKNPMQVVGISDSCWMCGETPHINFRKHLIAGKSTVHGTTPVFASSAAMALSA